MLTIVALLVFIFYYMLKIEDRSIHNKSNKKDGGPALSAKIQEIREELKEIEEQLLEREAELKSSEDKWKEIVKDNDSKIHLSVGMYLLYLQYKNLKYKYKY